MAIQLQGANAVNINADAGSNAERVTLYDINGNPIAPLTNANTPAAGASIVPIGGTVDGSYKAIRVDRYGNLRVGFDTLLMRDECEGTTLNSQIWTSAVSGFAVAQSATNGVQFNSGAVLTSGSYAAITTNKQFQKQAGFPLRFRCRVRVVNQSNGVFEFGFGAAPASTGAIPFGAFWRYTATGTIVPVLSYSSTDVVVGTDISASINSANYYSWEVVIDSQQVRFICTTSGVVVSEQVIVLPTTQPGLFGVTHIPAFLRLWNSAAPPAAPTAYMDSASVVSLDIVTNRIWSHQQAANGQGAEVNPTTFASNVNWTNSTAPANATLSNTAAGYSTLGGLFGFAAVAGAATDYCLFGLQIPTPYTFVMTGAHVSAYNTGAAVATTATLLQWGAFCNSPAVSLASAAPLMRAPIGAQSFLVGAAIGQTATELDVIFDAPLRTDPGRYGGIILRIPVGTATASQVIQGSVTMRGYFE
jgi:hypothetical protein